MEFESRPLRHFPYIFQLVSNALSLEVVAGQVIAAMGGLGFCATLNVTDWPADRQRDALTQLLTVLLPDVERIKKFC